jgi:hypothetical protein
MKLDKGNGIEYQIFYGKKTIFWEEKCKNSWTSFKLFNYHLKKGFFIFLYFCTILLLLTLQQIPMRSKQPKVECCHSLDIISAIFKSPEHEKHRSSGEFHFTLFLYGEFLMVIFETRLDHPRYQQTSILHSRDNLNFLTVTIPKRKKWGIKRLSLMFCKL